MTVRSRRLSSERDRTGSLGALEAPGACRAPVGLGNVGGAVADRIAQPEQDVVQRRSGSVPVRLFDAVGLGSLACPGGLQWAYLRPQLIQGRVEPGRRGVYLLTNGVLDRIEVVGQNRVHE